MLMYCGHPLVDVGVATITAFARKRYPSQLTEADVDKVVEYMMREYVRPPLQSFLTVAFPNSGFTQPAFSKQPEKRVAYAERVLRSYGEQVPLSDERCVFTGEPAVGVAFGEKEGLPAGRAFRQHIPLLTGEGVINFHPYGDAGLPVSGAAMLAIQALPLGSAKCGGRLLLVHSDNNEMMYYFAAKFLKKNRRQIQVAQLAGQKKTPGSHYLQRTLLIKTLLEASKMQRRALRDEKPFSLTAYHMSNSGQGPGLDIYYLPLQIVDFLRDMYLAEYKQAWQAIVHRAWEVPAPEKKGKKKSKKGKKGKEKTPFEPRRNWLYEDLFDLPEKAARFLRTYLLREALQYARKDKNDPRDGYSLKNEVELVSWKITERFLWRVMNMDKQRIAQIRAMGDRLATYVSEENDKRFFRAFFSEQRYANLRTSLIKANLRAVSNGYKPLVTLDPYIEVFEEGDELAHSQWRLARDLVLIRMVEQLYEQGWFDKNADAIPDVSDEDEVENDNE